MQINDTLTGIIEKIVYGGNGLIRQEQFVIFVPGTAPGEKVTVRITRKKSSYAIAELCEVLEPSPDRIEPDCRITGAGSNAVRVPGCVYDHLKYDAEVAIKQGQLSEFIRHLPDTEATRILPPFPSPRPLHYRNKLIVHTQKQEGTLRLGYQEERSHNVIDLPACPLACTPINEKLHSLRCSESFQSLPDHATVTIRYTEADGIVWWVNRPTEKSWITEESALGPLRVSNDGFFQTNPEVALALTQCTAAWFREQPSPHILDLYCGVGLFGLACMQAGAQSLTGLESGKRSVIAARYNAARLGIPANFQVRELGRSTFTLKQYTPDPALTTCIIDPPRAGMEKTLVQTLARSGLSRIIYISCDPATLQRDLKILITEGGYKIQRVQLFDMFPRTAHFETIVEATLP